MAQEFTLSFTASDINQKLGKIDNLASRDEIKALLDDKEKYITPEQYGAVGDGSTDDTVAFQNALNQCGSKVLYLQGDYKISSVLTVPDYTTIISDSKRQVNVYTTGSAVFASLNYAYIKGVFFSNQSSGSANFVEGKVFHSVIVDSSVKSYTNVFNGGVVNLSRIERNVFNVIKNKFCTSSVDSSFSHNYINASLLYFDNSICFGSINNTVIDGNYIDYWGKVFFTTTSNHVSTISNNMIDDCYIVFYHRVHNIAIVGNSFSNIHYDANNFSITLSEDKQKADWAIFRFQTTDDAGVESQFHDVTFTGNTLSNEVDYLILVDDNTSIHACVNSVQIIGNAIHPSTQTVFKTIASLTENNLKNMYIETLENVNYTELPSAQLNSSNGADNPIVSYHGHKVMYNNRPVININGTWYYTDGNKVSDNITYVPKTYVHNLFEMIGTLRGGTDYNTVIEHYNGSITLGYTAASGTVVSGNNNGLGYTERIPVTAGQKIKVSFVINGKREYTKLAYIAAYVNGSSKATASLGVNNPSSWVYEYTVPETVTEIIVSAQFFYEYNNVAYTDGIIEIITTFEEELSFTLDSDIITDIVYKYAQDGGYTGTKEEFAESLASGGTVTNNKEVVSASVSNGVISFNNILGEEQFNVALPIYNGGVS